MNIELIHTGDYRYCKYKDISSFRLKTEEFFNFKQVNIRERYYTNLRFDWEKTVRKLLTNSIYPHDNHRVLMIENAELIRRAFYEIDFVYGSKINPITFVEIKIARKITPIQQRNARKQREKKLYYATKKWPNVKSITLSFDLSSTIYDHELKDIKSIVENGENAIFAIKDLFDYGKSIGILTEEHLDKNLCSGGIFEDDEVEEQ